MDKDKDKEKVKNGTERASGSQKTLTVIGIVMCVILIPMLIANCTLLIKSFVNKDKVPDIGGMLPLIVLSDSMYPDIKSGDIIICRTVDTDKIEVGDVVSFYDPDGNGTSVVTHTVIEILYDTSGQGTRSFRTKGINNNTEDRLPVPADDVIATWTGVRIPGAGNVAIFMQSPTGLIICVVLPALLLIGYDVIRRRIYEKRKGDDMAQLMAELEALRAKQNTQSQSPEQSPEQSTDNASDKDGES